MAAVALDLTPVVDALMERPFDRPALDRAYTAVSGNPQAYATALRCAAKRTGDSLAAAYWFAEAARIHETVDDLGGAIALLARAWECDPKSDQTRELLAACMARLAMRAKIGFSFSTRDEKVEERAAARSPETSMPPPPIETGLRPPSRERHRDTLPDLFGMDGPSSIPSVRLGERRLVLADSHPGVANIDDDEEELEELRDSDVSSVFRSEAGARVEPMLPPRDATERLGTMVRAAPVLDEPVLRAVAEIAMPTQRTRERSSANETGPASAAAVIRASKDDVYGEVREPRTDRPAGDRLVGSLFEALHTLHFLEDVREAASFLCGVLEEKMRPATILVHVYDINSGHFLLVGAHGNRASALLDYATPEADPFVAEIMREDEATLVLEPATDPRLARGRWLLVEPQRSVVCAPVSVEGRYLGLIEIADPVDGPEFTEDDRNALTYAASAFARFLDKRGVVLSEEPTPETERADLPSH